MHKILRKIIPISLTVALTISLSIIFVNNSQKYTSSDYWNRYEELEFNYKNSQYVNKNPNGWMPDEVLYAYAGGYYIQGNNPVLVNVEAPPLGKYIIGLSVTWFGNENILIMVLAGMSAIIGMIILGKQIFKSYTLAIIPPLLLSLEPLFRNQFKYVPHFDILHMCWLLWSFICFNHARNTGKLVWWMLTSLIIGLFISTKFFMSGVPILAAMGLVLLVNKDWTNIKKFILTFPIAIITLLSMYVRVFAFGYSFREFLGIQKYIYLFWGHKFELPFTIWPLIYANQWYVWWGDDPILHESQWRVTWPIITTISLLVAALWLARKYKVDPNVQILAAFTVTYLGFLSIGQTTARYLVILQPILYILTVYAIIQLITKYRNKVLNRSSFLQREREPSTIAT